MRSRWLLSALLAGIAAFGAAPLVLAAGAPQVESVVEGRDTASGRPVLIVLGRKLTLFREFALVRVSTSEEFAVADSYRSKNLLLLGLPASFTAADAGDYTLRLGWSRGDETVPLSLAIGRTGDGAVTTDSFDPVLRADLDDATTLGGRTPSFFTDASNLDAGTVALARLPVGTGPSQIAPGDHDHDSRYDLKSATIDWSRLANVPTGFADGTDDGGYSVGDGLGIVGSVIAVLWAGQNGDYGTATTAARSDHLHDGRYYAKSQLNATGSINASSNPVDWTQLKGVPAGLADGLDDSVSFAGTGSAATAARSDHDHDATYLRLTGGTLSGAVTVSVSGTRSVKGTTSGSSGSASLTTTPVGVLGESSTASQVGFGVLGSAASPAAVGVWGENTSAGTSGSCVGVVGKSSSSTGTGIYGECISTSGTTFGVYASNQSSAGTGVYGENQSLTGTTYGLHGQSRSTAGTGAFGESIATTGNTMGVYGKVASSAGTAVLGEATSTSGTTFGMKGKSSSGTGIGVWGETTATSGACHGVFGKTVSTSASGVSGHNFSATGAFAEGVSGYSDSDTGTGVFGKANSTTGACRGMYGTTDSSSGVGVLAEATSASSGATALQCDLPGSSPAGTLAVFRSGATLANRARIDAAGKGYFNGGTQNGGADVAESVVASDREALGPGDVLVIDPSAPRRFTRSSSAESPLVAGVYATKPGVLLRNGDVASGVPAEEVPLAVVGIVPSKVCDEGGPIAIGDLLVTSSVPGHAKKAPANPKPGTLLGKALGGLNAGKGMIEVLLMAR